VNIVGAQDDNADFGRHSADRDSCASTLALDNAILAALADLGGGPVPWAAVRERLPLTGYWQPVHALVRLHESGRVHAVKVGGATIVASAA